MRPATRHVDVATTVLGVVVLGVVVLGVVVLAALSQLLAGRPETAIVLGVIAVGLAPGVAIYRSARRRGDLGRAPRGRSTTVVPVRPVTAEAHPPLAVPRERSGQPERVQCGLTARASVRVASDRGVRWRPLSRG